MKTQIYTITANEEGAVPVGYDREAMLIATAMYQGVDTFLESDEKTMELKLGDHLVATLAKADYISASNQPTPCSTATQEAAVAHSNAGEPKPEVIAVPEEEPAAPPKAGTATLKQA